MLYIRYSGQDVFRHVVHGSLDTGAVFFSKATKSNVAGRSPGIAKLRSGALYGIKIGKLLPFPHRIDICRQNTIPSLRERGVLVADEAVKGGSCALQDCQPLDTALDSDAVLAGNARLGDTGLVSILDKAVRVILAIKSDAVPAMRGHVNVGNVNVWVGLDKVVAEDRGELLRRIDGVLLGEDENGVLHGIRGYNNVVVGAGVGCLNVALEQAADGHLGDSVDAGLGVAVGFEDADIVFAVARRC